MAALAATVLLACILPQVAYAELEASLTPSTTQPYYACPHEQCQAIVQPATVKTASGAGPRGSYTAKELQAAYNIPTTGGSGQTVAVVAPYGYKEAENDLKAYREQYKLPVCKHSNGCFNKLNEQGEEANYPAYNDKWGFTSALELDMVSAACPECHIMLIEANTEEESDLGKAVDKAIELGATEVDAGYAAPENYEPWCGSAKCTQYDAYYSHPGVVITAPSGDYGYDNYEFGSGVDTPSFPASSPNVIAVGGTRLSAEGNSRGWHESAWIDGGSGCSADQKKPSWQYDIFCSKRTVGDIAADASCETPVAIYFIASEYGGGGGWNTDCGTATGAALVAGIEAHADRHTRTIGAEAFYEMATPLWDVTEGLDGKCGNYLCVAERGYDGPTGLGTPDGVPAATPEWLVHSSPNPTGARASGLRGDSCSSLTACTAVGYYELSWAKALPLAERWSGESWSIQTMSAPAEAETSELKAVSCPSASACMAVGTYQTATAGLPLTESWNGSEWKLQAVPLPTGAKSSYLAGVSCSSSSSCVAVGEYFASSSELLTLAEVWNGSVWKVLATPNPAESQSHFTAVSCTSSTACMATGYSYLQKTGEEAALSELWSGTEWKLLSTPGPSGATSVQLQGGVSCIAADECIATGEYHQSLYASAAALAEIWNGTAWNVLSARVPAEAEYDYFGGVSCASAIACTTVGAYAPKGSGERTLAERWNGTSWTIQSTPSPTGTSASWLSGVSCTSTFTCLAAGGDIGTEGTLTLAELYE